MKITSRYPGGEGVPIIIIIIFIISVALLLIPPITIPDIWMNTAGPFWIEFPTGVLFNWVALVSFVIVVLTIGLLPIIDPC